MVVLWGRRFLMSEVTLCRCGPATLMASVSTAAALPRTFLHEETFEM